MWMARATWLEGGVDIRGYQNSSVSRWAKLEVQYVETLHDTMAKGKALSHIVTRHACLVDHKRRTAHAQVQFFESKLSLR